MFIPTICGTTSIRKQQTRTFIELKSKQKYKLHAVDSKTFIEPNNASERQVICFVDSNSRQIINTDFVIKKGMRIDFTLAYSGYTRFEQFSDSEYCIQEVFSHSTTQPIIKFDILSVCRVNCCKTLPRPMSIN